MKSAQGDPIRSIDLPARFEGHFHVRPLAALNVPRGQAEVPHRHNFQELIWVRAGRGRHAIDGKPFDLLPGTCYLIARGQIHQFLEAQALDGCVVRFGEELVADLRGAGEAAYPLAWFNSAGGACGVRLDPVESREYDRLLALMAAEFERPPQAGRHEILASYLRIALVELGRALMRSHTLANGPDAPRAELFRAFILLLEGRFDREHAVAHYAGALHVAPRRLIEAARQCAGRMPKQIIEDRLMLEAKRMLRFTGRSTKQIAYDLGFEDPSYFSKVFRRLVRCSPAQYRRRLQTVADA